MERDRRNPGKFAGWLSLGVAGFLGLILCGGLAWHVWQGQGNLAWDDADYLRRGLRIANRAVSAGAHAPLSAVSDLLSERPKPPMLVGWIAAWAFIISKAHVLLLVEVASVFPFALVILALIVVSRQRYGPASGPIAVLALAASPIALAFGAKVMVETFLGLWILLTIHFAALVLERPTRFRCLSLGSSIGLAMMTKLTVALLLPAPGIAFFVLFVRRFRTRSLAVRSLFQIVLPILLIAGPWYARNGREAVDFARFSARYNVVAEGKSDRTPTVARLESMASEVAGWPGLLALAGGLIVACLDRTRRIDDFRLLASLSAVGGAAILLLPTYFDPRFLMPIWPSLAVICSSGFGRVFDPAAFSPASGSQGERRGPQVLLKAAIAGLLVLGVVISVNGFAREPRSSTSWAARELIDELAKSGVRTIANVGNTADWNVCKTGLLNELRSDPSSCFVLHDLSAEDEAGFRRRSRRMDAVIVLGSAALPTEILSTAPGLNRAFLAARSRLQNDPEFTELPCSIPTGLPSLSIFVKRSRTRR